MSFSSAYGHGDRADDPTAERRAARVAERAEELLASQTSRQKEIAGRIYQELKAGAHVEDIEHLVAQLRRATIEDARDRSTERRPGGRR